MLKQLTIAAVLGLSATTVHAQKGNWLIDANGTFKHHNISNDGGTTNKPVSISDWNIFINAGYQFHNHWIAGISGGYGTKDYIDWFSISTGSYYNYYGYKMRASTWAVGVFGRYTYPINNWLFIYSQLEIHKYGSDSKQVETFQNQPVAVPAEYYGTPGNGNGINAALYPAIGMNIIKGYGIDMSIGGLAFNHFNGFTVSDNSFNLTLAQEIRFGIHKFIGSKTINGQFKDPLAN